MDHQLARLQDLPQLILSIAMHHDARAVQSGTKVITRRAVDVDADVVAVSAEAVGDEAVSVTAEDNKIVPARLHQFANRNRQRARPLDVEAAGVEHGRAAVRGAPAGAVCVTLGVSNRSEGALERLVDERQQRAAAQLAGRVAPVEHQCQQRDRLVAWSFFDLVQEAAQFSVAPLRHRLSEGDKRLLRWRVRGDASLARLLMQERMRLWRITESDALAKLVGALQSEAVAIGDDREDECAAVSM